MYSPDGRSGMKMDSHTSHRIQVQGATVAEVILMSIFEKERAKDVETQFEIPRTRTQGSRSRDPSE